ncbi:MULTISPECIES: hypothetical protein [unclassified Microcoleus]
MLSAIVNRSLMMSPTPGYSKTVKPESLKMYVNSIGFRAIKE